MEERTRALGSVRVRDQSRVEKRKTEHHNTKYKNKRRLDETYIRLS